MPTDTIYREEIGRVRRLGYGFEGDTELYEAADGLEHTIGRGYPGCRKPYYFLIEDGKRIGIMAKRKTNDFPGTFKVFPLD